MEHKEILNVDGRIFNKLESMQNALSNSILEPICMRSTFPSYGEKRGAFSLMFYYAEDHGEDIIKKRIELASEDIKEVINQHENILLRFFNIESILRGENRVKISEEVNNLCDEVHNYIDFVEEHQNRIRDNYFLYFPTCFSGHYTIREDIILELSFNPGQTKKGAIDELNSILNLNELFLNQDAELNIKTISTINQGISASGENHSYKNNLELIKQRLKEDFNFII